MNVDHNPNILGVKVKLQKKHLTWENVLLEHQMQSTYYEILLVCKNELWVKQLTFFNTSNDWCKVIIQQNHISGLFTDIRSSNTHGNTYIANKTQQLEILQSL